MAMAIRQGVLDAWRRWEHPAPVLQEMWVLGSAVRLQTQEPGFPNLLKNLISNSG